MFKQLHAYLVEASKTIRDRFAAANQNELNFKIEVSGRVDGDLVLTYTLGEYCTEQSKGRNLEKVLEEHLRRLSWNTANCPLELPKPY